MKTVINTATKCRIYPNRTQEQKIRSTLGCCRYIYNKMLERNEKCYRRRNEHLTYISMQNLLPGMKEYLPWLAEADSQALKYACRQLDTAYQKFFSHEAGHPRFHSKKGRQAYTTTNASAIHISDDRRKVKIPCLGRIKARGLRFPENVKLNHATVSMEPDGGFYVSINYKYEADIEPASTVNNSLRIIGLDYKLDGLYADSEGNTACMPHWFRDSQAELARQQCILSRRKGSRKGEKKSGGWHKQHRKVAKLQRKTANQRMDFIHKESRRLADSYDIVAVEDLELKAMSNKDFGNGKSVMDSGYGMFATMLDYKLTYKGGKLIKVSRWYPSSQTCSCCGFQDSRLKDLRIRDWTCPKCGAEHDRDVNAAINIRNEALKKAS